MADLEAIEALLARAIYEKRNGPGATAWGRLPGRHKAPYMDDAAAAIAVIDTTGLAIVPKEPNQQQLWAALDCPVPANEIVAGYRAMVLAAREPPP